MTIPKRDNKPLASDQDDWTLTAGQMLFMLRSYSAVETAFEVNDLEFFRERSASEEFKTLFGDVGFDEVYDRYETMLRADEVEPEELWLLATGVLKKLDDEIKDARPIEDWRAYLRSL